MSDTLEHLIFEPDNDEFRDGACGWCIGLQPGEEKPRPYFDLHVPMRCPRCHGLAFTLYPWAAIRTKHWWSHGRKLRHKPGRLDP